jgi:hypothetical protein
MALQKWGHIFMQQKNLKKLERFHATGTPMAKDPRLHF